MKLLFEDELVEAVVFLCATATRAGVPLRLVRRFQQEREKLYKITDLDERNSAFARLHLEWFREWGIEEQLAGIVLRFSMLNAALQVLALRKVRSRHEEGGELYVNEIGERNGIIAIRPERFASALDGFLNHELQHLNDMVDPAFGYSPVLRGAPASQERLVRERYRLLWDVTIDGRLLNSDKPTIATSEQREKDFHRAHNFLPEQKRREIFNRLWTNPSPKHDELMSLAADPRGINQSRQPNPGAPCSLCGFPSFHWADPTGFSPEILDRIQSEFPTWNLSHGVCRRCIEVYDSAQFAQV